MYSASVVPDNYGYSSAMDQMMAESKGTNAILTNFYAATKNSDQMALYPLKPFEMLNLDEYRPGVFFNALA
tara:strand:+ start:345 stop:557 length:213 start_codon:yes stop_codon:yes gene_type:complete